MKWKYFLSLISFILLSACTTDTSGLSGYMPLPDKFLGHWESSSKSTQGQKFLITQTPTGGILTEHGLFISTNKAIPDTTIITFKVFAIDKDAAYAIGKWQHYRDNTHQETMDPLYFYYTFSHSTYEWDNNVLSLASFRAIPHLTEKEMTAPTAFHKENVKNICKKPNTPSPCISENSFSSYSHQPQWK